MSYLFDACALLNLTNGGVLTHALALPASSFLICNAVYAEIRSIREDLQCLIDAGILRFIDDNSISASQYLELKEKHELGDGETECIVFAISNYCTLVFDDNAARKTAHKLIGENRVTGSIGILRACVAHSLLTREEAYAAYVRMKNAGGYFPEMTIIKMFS